MRPDPVVAEVGRKPQPQVRVDRVEPLLLELVGAELVQQADAATLLGQIQEHAATLALDHR